MTDVTQSAPSAQIEVQAIKFIDVRKKELMYVKFTVGLDEYVINVGKETFEKVGALVNKAIAEKMRKEVGEQLKATPVR